MQYVKALGNGCALACLESFIRDNTSFPITQDRLKRFLTNHKACRPDGIVKSIEVAAKALDLGYVYLGDRHFLLPIEYLPSEREAIFLILHGYKNDRGEKCETHWMRFKKNNDGQKEGIIVMNPSAADNDSLPDNQWDGPKLAKYAHEGWDFHRLTIKNPWGKWNEIAAAR